MPEGIMIGNTQVPYLPPLQGLKLCYYIGGEEEACDQAFLKKDVFYKQHRLIRR